MMSHAATDFMLHTCTCSPQATGAHHDDTIMAVVANAAQALPTWMARSRQRRQLRELDDRLLNDIGVAKAAALNEASKPFWR